MFPKVGDEYWFVKSAAKGKIRLEKTICKSRSVNLWQGNMADNIPLEQCFKDKGDAIDWIYTRVPKEAKTNSRETSDFYELTWEYENSE